MRILNICDSEGENDINGQHVVWDNWVINCIDNNPADGKNVRKPNGSGVYVCGNAIIQYKIKKEDFKKYYTGDMKALLTKDFTAYFDQNTSLIAITIK